MTGTIEGVVSAGFYLDRPSRFYVEYEGQPNDCVLDAVMSLALRQGGITPTVGQRLRVTVEVVDTVVKGDQ